RAGWVEKDLSAGSSIHVHLLVGLAVHLHADHRGRKRAGDGRRGQQNVAEQLESFRAAVGGDGAHVPDHRLARIQIGRSDQENPPFRILRGNLVQKPLVHEAGNQIPQRAIVRHAIVSKRRQEVSRKGDVLLLDAGVDGSQDVIVFGSEEGKGGNQGSGA